MRIFIDTANIEQIKEAYAYGIADGVTTNPTLVAREGREFTEVLTEIAALIGDDVVFGEVVALDHQGMVKEARELHKLSDNIAIKIPMGGEGLKAISILSAEGIPTNCTLIFSAAQALLAARAGAAYVSPFVGRLDDIGSTGIDLIQDISDIYAIHGIDTKIIAASTRSPLHAIECALAGADYATLPPAVIEKMLEHPLTTKGLDQFMKDWEELQENL